MRFGALAEERLQQPGVGTPPSSPTPPPDRKQSWSGGGTERTDRCVERLRSQNTKWISGVDLPLIVPSALMDNSCETSADSFFPLKLKHTSVASSRLGSRLVSAKRRRWDDSYLQPSLFDRHYCLTQCFPKSHRSDRITPKFAAPTACLFNTNRFFFFYHFFADLCLSLIIALPLISIFHSGIAGVTDRPLSIPHGGTSLLFCLLAQSSF